MRSKNEWYTVYTKPKCELKKVEIFTKKNISVYCPLNKVVRRCGNRRKIILESLLKYYLFINIKDKYYTNFLQTDGIINFAHWLNKPAALKDAEIKGAKEFLIKYDNIPLEKIALSKKDPVMIKANVLNEQEGDIIGFKSKFIEIHLPALSFKLVTRLNYTMWKC